MVKDFNKHFAKEDTLRMANKHMKRGFASSVMK